MRATIDIAGQEAEAKIPAGAKEVVFNLKLKAGKTKLNARFFEEDGKEFGAYFVYVTRK